MLLQKFEDLHYKLQSSFTTTSPFDNNYISQNAFESMIISGANIHNGNLQCMRITGKEGKAEASNPSHLEWENKQPPTLTDCFKFCITGYYFIGNQQPLMSNVLKPLPIGRNFKTCLAGRMIFKRKQKQNNRLVH